jgi:hypothetical protein
VANPNKASQGQLKRAAAEILENFAAAHGRTADQCSPMWCLLALINSTDGTVSNALKIEACKAALPRFYAQLSAIELDTNAPADLHLHAPGSISFSTLQQLRNPEGRKALAAALKQPLEVATDDN